MRVIAYGKASALTHFNNAILMHAATGTDRYRTTSVCVEDRYAISYEDMISEF
jgi:hypothetical protein